MKCVLEKTDWKTKHLSSVRHLSHCKCGNMTLYGRVMGFFVCGGCFSVFFFVFLFFLIYLEASNLSFSYGGKASNSMIHIIDELRCVYQ